MRSIFISTAIAACATCANSFAADIKPDPVSGKVDWIYDYAEGRAAAKKSGKPMFVVFRCER